MRGPWAGALIVALLGPGPAAAEEAELPDLSDRIDSFQQERAEKGSGNLTPSDREALKEAMARVRESLPDPGLEVGSRAPDFTLPNAFGEDVSLADQLAKGPVILTFYRGAWCPYCNLELKALQESLPAFHEEGARLLAVSPQKPGESLEQVKEEGLPFEVLSDLDNQVMKDYNLFFRVPDGMVRVYKEKMGLDLADYNGDGRYVLPVPATFVIDREGVIRAAFARVDYKKRMEPGAILEALRELPRDG